MDTLGVQHSRFDQNTKLLQNFREMSSLSPKNGAKSMVQMSADGNSVICTRHNSALVKFIARVITKLSSIDLYDKFCIANPRRQQRAVEKFCEILEANYHCHTNGIINAKSLSLNDVENILNEWGIGRQDSSANLIRKLFSISNFDQNKIASGDFRGDLNKFAGINIDDFPAAEKHGMQFIYNKLKTAVQEGMEEYEFNNDEIGYVLASIIEEAKSVFTQAPVFADFNSTLTHALSRFIVDQSENLGNDNGYGTEVIKRTADNALKLMKDFAEFSDFVRGTGPDQDLQHGFAKIALLPALAVSRLMHADVADNMAAGGGTTLAVLERFAYQAINAQNPQLARCASFEPILAVLKMSGLMRSANNSYNNHEKSGKINAANVQEAWNSAATEFLQEIATQQT